jgi:murein DD-endopeptidase MepM/ murein hydrolase activator NlpD
MLVMAVALALPALAAEPPAQRTYFTLIVGLGEPYDTQAECLTFKGDSLCTSERLCGPWQRTAADTFEFAFAFTENGEEVEIEGAVRFDKEGSLSSIAGISKLRAGGQTSTFGLTGQSVKKKSCSRLLREWDIAATPNQPFQDGECLLRANGAGFGKPARSSYILPFPAGRSYYLSQTYCYLFSTHRNEMAYDFDIPLGAEIIAARGGEVIEVVDDRPNNNPWPNANYLKIRHRDGTVAHYIHVMQDSVPQQVGDSVEQGERIARSAMSGTIDPHLHFVVFRGDPPVEGDDVPVNFSNCEGPIDPLGGLIQDQTYRALDD